jgi:hypothetical protein
VTGTHPSDATRWVVTALGDTQASVEVDDRIEHVPRWLLPANAREGDVLAVEHARAGARASLVVSRAQAATRAALEASARQLRDAPKDPKGGDITL